VTAPPQKSGSGSSSLSSGLRLGHRGRMTWSPHGHHHGCRSLHRRWQLERVLGEPCRGQEQGCCSIDSGSWSGCWENRVRGKSEDAVASRCRSTTVAVGDVECCGGGGVEGTRALWCWSLISVKLGPVLHRVLRTVL
jgi:hypothetical protein